MLALLLLLLPFAAAPSACVWPLLVLVTAGCAVSTCVL
jgi:hypothetical protein